MASWRLFLGADEQDGFTLLHAVAHKPVRFLDERGGKLQIDDVDIVSRRKDVLFHLGVPLSRLVSEMDAASRSCFIVITAIILPPFFLPAPRKARNAIRMKDLRTRNTHGKTGVNFQRSYFTILCAPWQAIWRLSATFSDFFAKNAPFAPLCRPFCPKCLTIIFCRSAVYFL